MAVKGSPGIFANDLRAIILDMDGVLVDSEPVHAESFRIFFKHHHIPYTETFLDSLVGYSTDDNIATINRLYLSEKPIDIGEGIREKNNIYLNLINNLQLEPLEGIDAPPIESVARNMGWLTWADLFKCTMRAALVNRP